MQCVKDFFKELQAEMNNQNNNQSAPSFWVVEDLVRSYYNANEDKHTGLEVVFNKEVVAINLKEFTEFLASRHNKDIVYIDDDFDRAVITETDGKKEYFYFFEDLLEYAHRKLGYSKEELYLDYYIEEYKVVRDTLFLTEQECLRHIEANRHNYNKPHAFVATAYRSPQFEKLCDIIKNTDWDNF